VVISASGLGRKITYGDVVSRREGMLLRVQVALENQSKNTVPFEYRWEWTDGKAFSWRHAFRLAARRDQRPGEKSSWAPRAPGRPRRISGYICATRASSQGVGDGDGRPMGGAPAASTRRELKRFDFEEESECEQ